MYQYMLQIKWNYNKKINLLAIARKSTELLNLTFVAEI
jgi:hypothetical protein